MNAHHKYSRVIRPNAKFPISSTYAQVVGGPRGIKESGSISPRLTSHVSLEGGFRSRSSGNGIYPGHQCRRDVCLVRALSSARCRSELRSDAVTARKPGLLPDPRLRPRASDREKSPATGLRFRLAGRHVDVK